MSKPTSARGTSSIDLAHHIIKKWQQDEATSQLFGPSTELDAIDRLAGYIALAIEDVDQRGVVKGLRMAVQDFNFYRETAKVIEDEIVRLESELKEEK